MMNEPVSPISSSAPSSPSSQTIDSIFVVKEEPSTCISFSQEDFTKVSSSLYFFNRLLDELLGHAAARVNADDCSQVWPGRKHTYSREPSELCIPIAAECQANNYSL